MNVRAQIRAKYRQGTMADKGQRRGMGIWTPVINVRYRAKQLVLLQAVSWDIMCVAYARPIRYLHQGLPVHHPHVANLLRTEPYPRAQNREDH